MAQLAEYKSMRDTVLITGAAKRIGRGLAKFFADKGWQVAVHYHGSAEAAEDLVHEFDQAGHVALAFKADLANQDEVDALLPRVAKDLMPPTCLINNAALFEHDDIASLDHGQWQQQMGVNLEAPVFLAKAFAETLPGDVRGNVINIIDQRVWRLTTTFLSYTVAKSGLWAATQMLAVALAPRIRVNAIGPGPVLQSIHQTPEEFAKEAASTPLTHGTTPEEIAAAIAFILDAPAMTGQMIALDGGQHLDHRKTR